MTTITERTPETVDGTTTKSLDGFRKVANEVSPSLVHAVMWNPDTDEVRRIVVEDYEYAYPDGPFMTDSIRQYGLGEVERIHDMPVDEQARHDYDISRGNVFVGAEVRVTRGRKVPVGTTGTVIRIRKVNDRYGRHVATYADIRGTDGRRHSTSVDNLTPIA